MGKPLLYSIHAETVIAERGLSKSWVENAVWGPDWIEADPNDPEVERRFKRIETAGGRYIRVACIENPMQIRIISAFLDRRARKPL